MAGLTDLSLPLAFVWPPQAYLWFKSLHIVGVVVWFAGLFYLVRLFIYHREAEELEEPLRQAFQEQYGLMERRLANIITTPGMAVAVAMALGLLSVQPGWLKEGWMHSKLAIVALLLAYHAFC
jgi:putative membrane protein